MKWLKRKVVMLPTEKAPLALYNNTMYVDGRYNMNNVIEAVKERNKRMKNFPHKIAYSFAIYNKT